MAEFSGRHPKNVPGKYYVGNDCTDCDACRDTAPGLFKRDDSRGASYVFRQPNTPEQIALAEECLAGCCVQTIGNDGDLHDWKNTPIDPSWDTILYPENASDQPSCGCHREETKSLPPPPLPPPAPQPKRPWWRFW